MVLVAYVLPWALRNQAHIPHTNKIGFSVQVHHAKLQRTSSENMLIHQLYQCLYKGPGESKSNDLDGPAWRRFTTFPVSGWFIELIQSGSKATTS